MDENKRQISSTTNGAPPAPGLDSAGAPQPIDPATGQHAAYWVLSAEERAKGFVRPVRTSYRHIGVRPKYPLRDLTPEEQRADTVGYVKYEKYPESGSIDGRFWTQKQLESGCGSTTTMGQAIAETYARDPKYYGATFCCACRAHFPVGEFGEFVWEGSSERVGT